MTPQVLAYFLAVLSLVMSGMLVIRLRAPYSLMVWFPNLASGALAPVWLAAGVTGAGIGLISGAPVAVVAGVVGAIVMGEFLVRVVGSHNGVVETLTPDWRPWISDEQHTSMLKRRWSVWMPDSPEPRWERDLVYWTLPGTTRRLLCDLWQPLDPKASSGLAILFFHGSAWYVLRKDFGTLGVEMRSAVRPAVGQCHRGA